MTYQEIRSLNIADKITCPQMNTEYIDYVNFSVCKCSNSDQYFLVDADIARKIALHLWCIDGHGYLCSRISNKMIRLHDYVMAQDYQEKPIGNYVDHINHDKLDNRRVNLRFVTATDNSRNISLRSNNRSGKTGVCMAYGKYRAYITVNKKKIGLGYYEKYENAVNARMEAEERFGFGVRPTTIAELCEMEDKKDEHDT